MPNMCNPLPEYDISTAAPEKNCIISPARGDHSFVSVRQLSMSRNQKGSPEVNTNPSPSSGLAAAIDMASSAVFHILGSVGSW